MNNQFQDNLKNPHELSFFPRETTPDEVAGYILKNSDTKKTGDLYGIKPKFAKISAALIKNKLSLIINKSFWKGVFWII